MHLREFAALDKIQKRFKGRISQEENCYVWHLCAKEDVKEFVIAINGYVFLKSKDLNKVLSLYHLTLINGQFSLTSA